jgi:hypothetical protein
MKRLVIQLKLIGMSDNLDRNMNSFVHSGIYEQEGFHTVLKAARKTETTQENIQDWLELDEGDPRFQLLTEEEIATVIQPTYIIN